MFLRVMSLIVLVVLGPSAMALGTGGGGNGGNAPSTEKGSAADLYNKGYDLAELGMYADAIQNFQKAIALKPSFPEAYNMMGFSYRKMGKIKEAFENYDKALQLKPDFPEAREYLGEAWLQAGDLSKAVQQYIILQKANKKEEAGDLLEAIDRFVNKK